MKRFLLPCLLAVLCWTGCTNATFTEPMPLNRRDLNQFPARWQGTWTNGDDLTIQIHPTHIYMESSDETIQLGQSARLRRFHGYLVLSQAQDDPNRWNITLGRRWKDEIKLWEFEANNEAAVAVWQEILQAEGIESVGQADKQSYVLSPENNAAFRKLLTQGGTTSSGSLTRVVPVQH